MGFLQRVLAFIVRRRPTSQSTEQVAPSSTYMFHGVSTVTIIGGTFIMIGRLLHHWALLDNY